MNNIYNDVYCRALEKTAGIWSTMEGLLVNPNIERWGRGIQNYNMLLTHGAGLLDKGMGLANSTIDLVHSLKAPAPEPMNPVLKGALTLGAGVGAGIYGKNIYDQYKGAQSND